MKALGKPTSFLGVEMSWPKDSVYLSRKRLIEKLPEDKNMVESKLMKTPMSNNQVGCDDDQLRLGDKKATKYRSNVGSLL